MNNNRLPQGVPLDIPLIGQQKSVQPGHAVFPGHLAQPVAFPAMLNGRDGQPILLTFGGLSKLEAAAIQIAAGMASNWPLRESSLQELSIDAVAAAQKVLAECERASHEQDKQQSDNDPTEQK